MDTNVLLTGEEWKRGQLVSESIDGITRYIEHYNSQGILLDKYHEIVYNGKVFGPLRSQREIDACLYKLKAHDVRDTGCREHVLPKGTPVQ